MIARATVAARLSTCALQVRSVITADKYGQLAWGRLLTTIITLKIADDDLKRIRNFLAGAPPIRDANQEVRR